MANTSQRGRRNNNPKGHNQYTNQWLAPVKDHPVASAAAAAAAVGAGVFLWSKRNQVGNQVNRISSTANELSRRASNKAGEWLDRMQTGSSSREVALTAGPNESSAIESSRSTASRSRSKSRPKVGSGRAGAEPVRY